MVGRIGVCEPVSEEAIDQCSVAIFRAGAESGEVMRSI